MLIESTNTNVVIKKKLTSFFFQNTTTYSLGIWVLKSRHKLLEKLSYPLGKFRKYPSSSCWEMMQIQPIRVQSLQNMANHHRLDPHIFQSLLLSCNPICQSCQFRPTHPATVTSWQDVTEAVVKVIKVIFFLFQGLSSCQRSSDLKIKRVWLCILHEESWGRECHCSDEWSVARITVNTHKLGNKETSSQKWW